MSTQPLMAYSVGLIGIILVKTLAPAFYARQDIRTPVRIAIGVLIATQLMNLLFVPLHRRGRPGPVDRPGRLPERQLPVLRACASAASTTPKPGWAKFFLRLLPALIVMGGVAYAGAVRIDWIAMQAHPLLRAGALALVVALCGVAYFATLLLRRLPLPRLQAPRVPDCCRAAYVFDLAPSPARLSGLRRTLLPTSCLSRYPDEKKPAEAGFFSLQRKLRQLSWRGGVRRRQPAPGRPAACHRFLVLVLAGPKPCLRS